VPGRRFTTLLPLGVAIRSGHLGCCAASLHARVRADLSGERFLDDSFWTSDYAGAGPYRIERWERGVQLDGGAFSGHGVGEAKIAC
jgi:hypothetical protein